MQAASQQPDLMILDLGLPDIDGMEVIRQVREWSHMPIVILSARGQEHEKVEALDAGADDYLTKPFSVGELVARIRVALRHAAQDAGESGEPVFVSGRSAGRSGPPAGVRRRRGNPSDADRIPPADDDDQVRRKGDHPPAASQGSLGAGQRLRDALPSRLHGPASPQDRSRPGPAAVSADRAGRGLPPGNSVT